MKSQSPLPFRLAIAALIGLVALCQNTIAADAELRGRVTDAPSGTGLPEAKVELIPDGGGATIETTADFFGLYELPVIPPGSYTLKASFPGYATFSDTRVYAMDALEHEDIPLVPLVGSGPGATDIFSTIELRVQTFDASAQQPLEDVPFRIRGFTLTDPAIPLTLPGETSPGVIVGTTGGKASIAFPGLPKGHYDFRFNNPADGVILSFYDEIEVGLRGKLKLETSHSVVANLNPIKSTVKVLTGGDDPVDLDAGAVPLNDVYVELQAVSPDFVPPPADPDIDWRDDDQAQELLPPMLNRSMKVGVENGVANFPLLPPLNYIVTATKPGYFRSQSLLVPDGSGALPSVHPVSMMLDDRTELLVVLESPYLDFAMLMGLDIHLEGIEGTATAGIDRLEPALPGPSPPGAAFIESTFVGIVPGRYRASVGGMAISPTLPALEDASSEVAARFRGEKYFEVIQGEFNLEVVEIEPIPAIIRGRLFVADERESVGLGKSGALPHPLDRWEGPAYRLREQADIKFIESAVSEYLAPPNGIVSVDADKDGTFVATVMPGFWGIEIPTMTGYFGSNYRSLNVVTGEVFALGWPYYQDPGAGLPVHPFGSAGIPINSGDEIEIDLFVRKQVYYLQGAALVNEATPALDRAIDADDSTLDLPFSHIAGSDASGTPLGFLLFDPDGPGAGDGPELIDFEQGISGTGDAPRTPNPGARFTIAAPPGIHTLDATHSHFTFPSGTATFALPDYDAPGKSPLTFAPIPLEDAPLPPGFPDPLDTSYNTDHSLLLKFIGKSPSGAEVVRFTRDRPDFVYHGDLGARMFRVDGTAPTFMMANSDGWEIWISHVPTGLIVPDWYYFAFDLDAIDPAIHEIKIYLQEEWGAPPFGSPTVMAPTGDPYDLTFNSINVDMPDASVPGLMATFDGIAGIKTSTYTKMDHTGGYTPLTFAPPAGWMLPFPEPATDPPIAYDVTFDAAGIKPKVTVTGKLRRGSNVMGRLIVDGITEPELPIPGAEITIFNRYGLVLKRLATMPDGTFSTAGGALPRAEAIFVEVDFPGFKPFRIRKAPNADVDPTPGDMNHDYDLGDIGLVPLPKPTFLPPTTMPPTSTSLLDSFDRSGLFLVGVRKSGDGTVLSDSPNVLMKYTLEAKAPAKYALAALPAFDNPDGSTDGDDPDMVADNIGGAGAEIEDQVRAIYIIDPRSFPMNPSETGSEMLFTLPPMADPSYNLLVRDFLRKVNGHFPPGPPPPPPTPPPGEPLKNMFAMKITDFDVTDVGGVKHYKTKPTSKPIDLASLPPGVFQPYVIAETQRGTFAHFQLKYAGTDPAYKNLYGMKLPPWLAFLADTAATVGAIKEAGEGSPVKMGDVFPIDIIEMLPNASGIIGLNDGEDLVIGFDEPDDNTLYYVYNLEANFAEGAPVPGSSLLGFAPGFAGLSLQGDLLVEVNGSAFAPSQFGAAGANKGKVGHPGIRIEGGVTGSASTENILDPTNFIPRGVPKNTRKAMAKSKSAGGLKLDDASLTLNAVGEVKVISREDLVVPFTNNGKVQTLERVVDISAFGGVTVSAQADVSAFAEKVPYVGPFVTIARRGANFGIVLASDTAVGASMRRTITTTYAPPDRFGPTGLRDAADNRYPGRRNVLGEDFLPLPPKTKKEGSLLLGFNPSLTIKADRGISASATLALETLGTKKTILKSRDKFRALDLELNQFGDWPPVKRAVGKVRGTFGARANLGWLGEAAVEYVWADMKVDVPFNTEESLHVDPYLRVASEMSLASFPDTTTWCGAGLHLVDHLYPQSDFRLAEGAGSDALVYTGFDSVTGLMSVEISLRTGPSTWAPPATVATAAAVLEVAAHELPAGGWMVVWSEIAAADLSLLSPPTTIKWETFSTDLTTSTGSGTVSVQPGTVFDMCLVPMPLDTLGLMWLESFRGPNSLVADITGATFAGGSWAAPTALYPGTPVTGWDVAGSGFTGTEPTQIFAFVDTAGLLIGAWDGGPTPLPPVVLDPALIGNEVRMTSGPPDTFLAAWPNPQGGLGLAKKTGAGAWLPLPDPMPGASLNNLALAPVDDGASTHYFVAWTSGSINTSVGFMYLDPSGVPLTDPDNIQIQTPGLYSQIEALPVAGAHSAVIVTKFDNGGDIGLRTFTTTEASGLTALDSDGDGLLDITEMAIIDADPDDALNKPADVLAAGDFDGDGDSNFAEQSGGTDPTDPDHFLGQVVEAEISPLDTAQEHGGAQAMMFITRTGDYSAPLTVHYTLSGTAGEGSDYTSPGGSVLIEAGAGNAAVLFSAIPDVFAEGDETVVLTIDADPAYTIGASPSATATIADSPFDAWRAVNFTPAQQAIDEAGGFVLFDPDDDTLSSVLEYGFGDDPNLNGIDTIPSSGVHEDVSGDRFREFTYRRRVADLEFVYQIEVSATLGTWTAAAPGDFTEISVTDNGDGTETVTIRDTAPLSDAPRGFVRVTMVRVSG